MYGWRGRIGLLATAINTTMEPEFWQLVPPGVSVHTTRVPTERDGQTELCESLGSTDKRSRAYPGRHADDGPEALESSAAFLNRYLR